MLELILGGARSGKSRYAEKCAAASGLNVIYLATAQALDSEMQQRITHHQQQRPQHWLLVEEPIHLVKVLQQHANDSSCILVDCLTLWLSNLLCSDEYKDKVDESIAELIKMLSELAATGGKIIFVSNEVSMGIIPMGEINRKFVDEAGRLHQGLAEICDKVTLMVAGIPSKIK